MKTYKKVQVVAKNNPLGSYVAGCPADKNAPGYKVCQPICRSCERTQ